MMHDVIYECYTGQVPASVLISEKMWPILAATLTQQSVRTTERLLALVKTLYLTNSLQSVTLGRFLFTLLCTRLLCTELHRVVFFTGQYRPQNWGQLDCDDLVRWLRWPANVGLNWMWRTRRRIGGLGGREDMRRTRRRTGGLGGGQEEDQHLVRAEDPLHGFLVILVHAPHALHAGSQQSLEGSNLQDCKDRLRLALC